MQRKLNHVLIKRISNDNYEDGEWKADPGYLSTYFVDGPLLCTIWQDSADSEILGENWEIVSIKNGVMKATALRVRADGSTYTATFELTKVN